MTSKEALENWYNTESPRTKAYEYEQHYRLIKKDLEVLEIIRTHKLLNYVIKNKKCATMYRLTDEELNTLKEWERKWKYGNVTSVEK